MTSMPPCSNFFAKCFLIVFDQVASPFASFNSFFAEELLSFGFQAVKYFGIGDEDIIFVDVIPDGHVLLNLVDFGRVCDGETVFLPVDCALLNRGESLAPTHCHGVCAESMPEFEINFAARHTNL